MISRFVCLLSAMSVLTWGQTFNSGSNGSDGALNLTTPGLVVFDPAALNLNAAGDNVFNFTTINIGVGVTVKLLSGPLRYKPVVWLASGAVTIAGTIDASGQPGSAVNDFRSSSHRPADSGPGGYAGGVGNGFGSGASNGFGPGGGPGGQNCFSNGPGSGAAHLSLGTLYCGGPGGPYGNAVLVPFRGGSGGGGGHGTIGGGGGGGGGAFRIASSISITLAGAMAADGGDGGTGVAVDPNTGGGGSGGAIHLIAPAITGAGTLNVRGGGGLNVRAGSVGRIRLDAFTQGWTGTGAPTPSFGTPYNVPSPTAQPAVRVTSIGGINVAANPTGSFITPDVVLNNPNPVTVSIQANNVPVGTVLQLYLFSEVGTDVVLNTAPLAGTLQISTATVQATFQPGYPRGFVRGNW